MHCALNVIWLSHFTTSHYLLFTNMAAFINLSILKTSAVKSMKNSDMATNVLSVHFKKDYFNRLLMRVNLCSRALVISSSG